MRIVSMLNCNKTIGALRLTIQSTGKPKSFAFCLPVTFVVGHLMTKHVWLLVLLLGSACSSTHDLKRDGPNYLGGGGFIDDEMAPGIYRIKGFSNTSLFATPDSAAKTFRLRAEQLCPAGYEEVRSVANSYLPLNGGVAVAPDPKNPAVTVLLPPLAITSKIGFVRCNDSPLSLYEAQMLVTPESEQ